MASVAGKKRKRGRILKKILAWVLVLAVAAVVIRFVVWPQLDKGATTTYNSYTARIGTISNALSFSGSVQVKNNETITASGAATVRQVYVSEGDKVTRDQKLLRLSDGTTVKASFDGEVNQLNVAVGDEVNANTSLIQIVDFENMQISMRVDEYAITELSVGQSCQISITALGKTFDSEIAYINRISSGGGSTAYYTVTAGLTASGGVLPGMAATVTIPQEEAVDCVILNRDALSFAQDNSAYVLVKNASDQMEQQPVTLGVDNDNYVEITSGLKDGDVVYAVATAKDTSASGLLSSLFSSLGGGMQPAAGAPTQSGGSNNSKRNTGSYGGGGGAAPGGMPGGF
ncbi:MAG: efflux RND transporter periplasmic adaptor subunit [Aristaeellaceae bacterium]